MKPVRWRYRSRLPDGQEVKILSYDPGEREEGVIDPAEVAAEAIVFTNAFDRCLEVRRRFGKTTSFLPLPAAVNGAFAIELSFKAILIANGISTKGGPRGTKNTHHLLELFDKLPLEVSMPLWVQLGVQKEFLRMFLSRYGDTFVTGRYFYEPNKPFEIDLGFIEALIINLEPAVWALARKTPPPSIWEPPPQA